MTPKFEERCTYRSSNSTSIIGQVFLVKHDICQVLLNHMIIARYKCHSCATAMNEATWRARGLLKLVTTKLSERVVM